LHLVEEEPVIRPRVLLADDHRVVAEGLKRLLSDDFELVGIVEDGRSLVLAARELRPDLIVADITMPHLNGIDALVQLRKDSPNIKVLFLTMHQEPAYARRAFELGAIGFVVKHSAPEELVMALNAALRGQTFISPSLTGEVLRQMRHESRAGTNAGKLLTVRQRQILVLLTEGKSAKEIAALLSISSRTVEFHKYQMMEALGLHSTAELIHFAIKQGIVTI
jgi:DNA-binding NarL/FixJ family response regulator